MLPVPDALRSQDFTVSLPVIFRLAVPPAHPRLLGEWAPLSAGSLMQLPSLLNNARVASLERYARRAGRARRASALARSLAAARPLRPTLRPPGRRAYAGPEEQVTRVARKPS